MVTQAGYIGTNETYKTVTIGGTPNPIPAIQRHTQDCANKLDALQNGIHKLRDKLTPVLTPESPAQLTKGSASAIEQISPLAQEISGTTESLLQLAAIVEDMINRLEV